LRLIASNSKSTGDKEAVERLKTEFVPAIIEIIKMPEINMDIKDNALSS